MEIESLVFESCAINLGKIFRAGAGKILVSHRL